jgi:acetyltransferase-like isoleucine patch superfamily enzyme
MSASLRKTVRTVLDRLPPRFQSWIDSLRARGRASLGPGSYVHRSVQMLGRRHVRLGVNSVLSQDCWLNVNHRRGDEIAIEIGSHCFIGRRNFFSSGRRIRIADHVLTANDCQFLGSTHIVDDPMRPVIMTGTTDHDVIEVGVNAFIGAGVRVVGSVRIGHGCVIGAGALVTRDLPPFSQAHGAPAVVRKRYSIPRARWVSADDLTPEEEAALPDEQTYLATLRATGPIRMPYIACGSDMGDC